MVNDHLVGRHGAQRIVLSGEARAVGLFREHLPRDIDRRVVAVIAAAAHEPLTTIAERGAEHLAHVDEQHDAGAVDRLLDAAGTRGRAVTGLEPTLEAVNRNAVQHLYLLADFARIGANRVLASGGRVGWIDRHAELGGQGGVGAILRYAA